MNDDNKQLVRRWFGRGLHLPKGPRFTSKSLGADTHPASVPTDAGWNRESVIDELLSPAGVGFGLAATDTEIHGPTEFKPFVRNMRSAFPDLHIAVEDTVAEGDKVAVRLRVTGTHKGDGLGFPPTCRKIDITAITIIQFANGKLVHGRNNWDQLGMMQQLGMAPGPVNMDRLLEKRD